jgi:hypothetical protein
LPDASSLVLALFPELFSAFHLWKVYLAL